MRYKKRPTKRLAEVIESDLLTATEKLICNEIGGFYRLCDEQAYFKTSSDKSSMSIDEFERHLKKINPNFFIVYNPNILPDHMVQGHQIGLYIDAYKGFVPFIKVGRNAQKTIPANSQGRVAKYRGKVFERTDGTMMDEEPLLYRGWVAAEEACKALIDDISKHGISPNRTITPAEFLMYRKTSESIDGQMILREALKEANTLLNAEQIRIKEEQKKIEDELIALMEPKAIEGEPNGALQPSAN